MKATIADMFMEMDGERSDHLDRVRRCAQLTKPWVLPYEENTHKMFTSGGRFAGGGRKDRPQPQNFQSLGSRMVSSMGAHMVMNAFPVDAPWMSLIVHSPLWYDQSVPEQWKLEAERRLWLAEMAVSSMLESAPLGASNRGSMGFHAGMWRTITNALVTGDSLTHLLDDFRVRSFRLDNYVTERDTAGDVLCHVIREEVDPLSLSEDRRAKLEKSDGELQEKSARERMEEMHTLVEWQPLTKRWVVRQEVCGKEIHVEEQEFSAFISAPFELIGGDNYGRGLAEANHGDLWTFDQIERSYIDFAATASKMHPVMDVGCMVRDEDLEQDSGMPIHGARVSGGVVQDMAFLNMNKGADFGVVQVVREAKRRDLGAAALLESEAAPRGEAGRHSTAWRMVYNEIQRVTGGHYVNLIGALQPGIVRRAMHVAINRRMVPDIDMGVMKVRFLTGLSAMRRDAEKQKLLQLAQFIQFLGPEAQARIDPAVATEMWQRYESFYHPGLIKSDQRVAQEQQAQIAAQTRLEANKKAVEVFGNVAEQGLLPQAA